MGVSIHPASGEVAFRDTATGTVFRTCSTIRSDRTVELDGDALPTVTVDTSSASHPFWTSSARVLDTAGGVGKFHARFGRRS